jgi:hypothetical protein
MLTHTFSAVLNDTLSATPFHDNTHPNLAAAMVAVSLE